MATTPITVAIISVALFLLACTAQTSHAQQLRAAGGGAAPTQLVPYKPWREHSRRASTTSSPPPPAPTSVTVTPGDRFVRVSYQHPHATESGPNSGTLFRVQASPGSQWALSCPGCGDSGHGVTYVANLDNGVAYTFTVVGHRHHVSLMIPTGSHHGCHAPCSLLTTHTLGSQTAIASDNQQSAPSLPSNPVTPAGTCPTACCLRCLSLATYPPPPSPTQTFPAHNRKTSAGGPATPCDRRCCFFCCCHLGRCFRQWQGADVVFSTLDSPYQPWYATTPCLLPFAGCPQGAHLTPMFCAASQTQRTLQPEVTHYSFGGLQTGNYSVEFWATTAVGNSSSYIYGPFPLQCETSVGHMHDALPLVSHT